jgi:hypothetical protein
MMPIMGIDGPLCNSPGAKGNPVSNSEISY